MKILINHEEYEVAPERLTYERIVSMALPDAPEASNPSVLWRIPGPGQMMGIMAHGMSVQPVDGMVIYVAVTGAA